MKYILVLGILAVIFITGCTSINSITNVNLGDLTKAPEKFLNKTVSIEGYATDYNTVFESVGIGDLWKIIDAQKYEFPIKPYSEPSRNLLPYSNYQVTGIVKSTNICKCQEYFIPMWGNPEWRDYPIAMTRQSIPIENCITTSTTPTINEGTGMQQRRCEDNSYSKFYYLEVTEPMKIIK